MFLIKMTGNYFLRSFVGLVAIQVVTTVLGFITTIQLANILGSANFGQIALGYAVGGIGAVIVRFGTDKSLVREYVQRPDEVASIFFGSLLLKLILFVIVSFTLYMLRDKFNLTIGSSFIAFATILTAFQMQSLFDATRRAGLHSCLFLVYRLVYFAPIWIVLLVHPLAMDVVIPGLSLIFSGVIYLILQFYFCRTRIAKVSFPQAFSAVKKLFLTNYLLVVSSIVAVMVSSFPQLILSEKALFAELGVFAVCWQFVGLSNVLLKQAVRLSKRELARYAGGTLNTNFSRVTYITLGIMIGITSPIALAILFFPDFILKMFFSEEYWVGGELLQLLGVYVFLRSIQVTFEQVLVSLNQPGAELFANIVNALIVIFMTISMIDDYGTLALGYGLILGVLASNLVMIFRWLWGFKNSCKEGAHGC